MPRKKTAAPPGAELDNQLDDILGTLLYQGWLEPVDDVSEMAMPDSPPPAAPPVPAVKAVAKSPQPDYPPLPVRYELPMVGQTDPSAPGLVVLDSNRPETHQDEPGGARPPLDIGLLTDLASGRAGAVEAAHAAGVTTEQLQSSLAIALRDTPPEEIAKALGLQAAEQQLKSGAIYGAVLAELVADMASGRMKHETKLEMAKLLAKIGRLEPKEEKAQGGSGFVLNISMGSAPQPIIIESN